MSGPSSMLRPLLSRLMKRQAIVVAALTVLAVGGYLMFERTLGNVSDDMAAVNISGRQRMLLQRIALFAHRMAEPREADQREVYRRLLEISVAEMEEGHRRLAASPLTPTLHAVYFGPGGIAADVHDFTTFARALAAPNETLSATRLEQLDRMAGDAFLASLDRVVVLHQQENQRRVAVLRIAMVFGLLLMIGVLLFSTLGVFRPMARQIIEELKAQEAAEEQTRLILHSAGEGILGLDLAGRITFVNRAACSHLGFDAERLIGQPMHPLVHHSRPDGSIYPAEECPSHATLHSGVGMVVDSEALWRRDGTCLPVKYCSTPIEKDGRLLGAVVTFSDITARTNAIKAMQAGEEIKARILDAALDAIVTIDSDGRIVEFNRAAEQIFGTSRDKVRGHDVAEVIIPAALRDAHRLGLARVAAGQPGNLIGRRMEMTAQHSSGKEFPVELAFAHIPEHGLFTAFIRDLTEQKRAETTLRRSQKMEAVGELTGGIAHDFNNLLGIIVGNMELLRAGVGDNEKALKRVDTALRSAKRGADLTQRLLSFARQDRALQANMPCNVNDLIGGILEMVQRSLTKKVDIRTYLDPELWQTSINRGEFEDSIVNLALNARDAMPEGGLLLIETCNLRLDPGHSYVDPNLRPGEYVVVSVSDTGCGIPKDIIDRILEPFFTTKERGKGTGLGLSMVYGFTKRSGGHVRCYSEPGIGSTFRLYLPRAAEAAADGATPGRPPEELPRGNGETVLVVDDEANLVEIAEAYLQDLGYATVAAADPREALRIIEARADIDLLFTDMVMPHGIDGFALERKLRELGRPARVLFTSGFTDQIYAEGGARLQAQLLGKPYSKAELARRVRQTLDADKGDAR